MSTDRRPLGTRPDQAESVSRKTAELPHAQRGHRLAAERLPAAPAATDPMPARPVAGRRALGTGTAPAGDSGGDELGAARR